MKFIDLFAGLGGFQNALKQLGHECVFASEINKELRDLYKENFDCEIAGDITKIKNEDIPSHDILCAGFPCQPFSHAGKQKGLCDKNGNLFFEIIRILEYHNPKYFILENVANLKSHDHGRTWSIIESSLRSLGYDIRAEILSPHEFGIPQHRKRIFIVGCNAGLSHFNWPTHNLKKTSIKSILDKNTKNVRFIGKREVEILKIWQSFLDKFPRDEEIPSFPIRAPEFGATYPFEKLNPINLDSRELGKYKGAFGCSLSNMTYDEQLRNLPRYVFFDKHRKNFPSRKINFIRKNREFYCKYKNILDTIILELKKYPLSFQKFEWNCKGSERNLFNHIIQFRASGIRIKNIDTSPSLISSTSSQIPIIGWEKRYLTPHEASKLQGMGNLKMPKSNLSAFKALGNALNSDIVVMIAKNLIK